MTPALCLPVGGILRVRIRRNHILWLDGRRWYGWTREFHPITNSTLATLVERYGWRLR